MQSAGAQQTPDYFADLKLPSVDEMKLQLEMLVEQGVLTPEEAQAELVGRSEMGNIQTDPRYKEAQLDALLGLQDVSEGGLTAMDRANLQRISNEENAAARGKRDAILQNAQSRGMGGSGLELMSQLQNEQDAATRKSQRDLDVAGMASERALQALIEAGELGGNMQTQDFNQQAQIAGANDAIAKFNATNQQAINLANTNARNAAQATNLENKQRVADTNVGLRNQQQEHNKQLIQQNFENELKKRSGQAGIATNNAQAQQQADRDKANAANQFTGGLLGLGGSALNGYMRKK